MKYRSQKIAYWYFVAALLLYGLQMVLGLMSAAKYLGPDPLREILAFDRTKAMHTNLPRPPERHAERMTPRILGHIPLLTVRYSSRCRRSRRRSRG